MRISFVATDRAVYAKNLLSGTDASRCVIKHSRHDVGRSSVNNLFGVLSPVHTDNNVEATSSNATSRTIL